MIKKFCIRILLVVAPFFAVIPVVNYCVDPTNVYHSVEYADRIVDAMKSGRNVSNVTELNDRIFKRKIAEANGNSHFEYLVVGSSRVKTISSDGMEASLLNLGMNGGNIYDIITSYEICVENFISFDKIIVGLDYYTLTDNEDSRWEVNSKYFYDFVGKPAPPSNNNIMSKAAVVNLLSLSYFQKAVSTFLSGRFDLKLTDESCNDKLTYHNDGSLCYGIDDRQRLQREVDSIALAYPIDGYPVVLDELAGYLEMLVDKLEDDGKEIYFYFAPYHPVYYSRICKSKTIVENEHRLYEIAGKYGIKTIGSFDPNGIGCDSFGFYDATHPRKEVTDSIFRDFFIEESTD